MTTEARGTEELSLLGALALLLLAGFVLFCASLTAELVVTGVVGIGLLLTLNRVLDVWFPSQEKGERPMPAVSDFELRSPGPGAFPVRPAYTLCRNSWCGSHHEPAVRLGHGTCSDCERERERQLTVANHVVQMARFEREHARHGFMTQTHRTRRERLELPPPAARVIDVTPHRESPDEFRERRARRIRTATQDFVTTVREVAAMTQQAGQALGEHALDDDVRDQLEGLLGQVLAHLLKPQGRGGSNDGGSDGTKRL